MHNRTVRILRILAITAYMFGCSMAATGQDVFSIYSRMSPPSPASGNGAQVGIGFDGVMGIGSSIFFDVDASAVREPKGYVGDGWTLRSQAEVNVRILPAIWIGGGWSASRHSNSSYAKAQYQPLISAHYRPSPVADIYVTGLLPANGNQNQVRGYRIGYRGSLLMSVHKRWGMFSQVEYNDFWFQDAFLLNHRAQSVTVGLGLSYIKQR